MHRQLRAVLHRAADLVDVGEVDLRVDALAEQVHPQRHQADVAGALAVAEQAALDAVGAGHHRQLGGRDRGATVVVRVQRDRAVLAAGQLAREPLDLVGVDVGRRHLDRGRQVQDDLAARAGLPHVGHGLADVDGELQLGAGEDLRGVLVAEVGVAQQLLGVLHHDLGSAYGDRAALVLVDAEHHATEQRRRGVVEVHVGPRRPHQRLDGPLDQVLTRLGQHRDRHVVGDLVALDELADEVEVGLARAREADLDLLVAHPDEEVEHRHLAGRAHRVDQRLVAVTEVRGQPAGGRLHRATRPGAVGEVDRGERAIALVRHPAGLLLVGGHDVLAWSAACGPWCSRHDVLPQRGVRLEDLAAAPKEEVARAHDLTRIDRPSTRHDPVRSENETTAPV